MMENMRGYGVQQSLIDAVTFYFANSVVSGTTGTAKPKFDETVIFGISDLLIRNNITGMNSYINAGKMGGNYGQNALIGVVSFVITNFYDLIQGKEFGRVIKDNLIKNAVGVVGNSGVDMVLSRKYQ